VKKDKINRESESTETARDKGVNSTDLLYSPYKMTVKYKQRTIFIEYNKTFLYGSPEIYARRLQRLTESIDWHIKNSFRKNKITTKNQV
jgi:hypothetical protein